MARVLVVNSGNANAFTGKRGREAVKLTAEAAAEAAGCLEADVYLASTGVIGEPLDPAQVHWPLGRACRERPTRKASSDAARAIMTTDTYPKLATRQTEIEGVPVTINGIAKGAGMIAPDMATMLAFLFTDAAIEPGPLREMLTPAADATFNAITIDGDTSTSDTLLLFATGTAAARGAPRIGLAHDPRLANFRVALTEVLLDLAHQVVKDGEGATKFVTVKVTGAETPEAARRIAFSIANSPLVKTAIAGEDPNWGRVVMAVGKAGEAADRDRLSISFGDILVAKEGEVAPSYREELGANYMKRRRDRHHRRCRRGRGEQRPCGPAISPPSTSPSTPTTGPDRRCPRGPTHQLLLVAACVLLDGEGRILIAKRPPGRSLAGLWEFPGGKVEQGELPEHALVRELAEELGIDIAPADLSPLTFASHAYPDFHLLMPLFLCTRWRGEATPHEGQELAWVKPRSLPPTPCLPPTSR